MKTERSADSLSALLEARPEKDNLSGVAALDLVVVSNYTTFVAEFGVQRGNLMFHFFKSPELLELPNEGQHYWDEQFPQVMSDVTEEYFQMKYPRVRAAYTPELLSWWMEASGGGQCLDPEGRALLFLSRLDAALDAVLSPKNSTALRCTRSRETVQPHALE